jgi:hypothetical protein
MIAYDPYNIPSAPPMQLTPRPPPSTPSTPPAPKKAPLTPVEEFEDDEEDMIPVPPNFTLRLPQHVLDRHPLLNRMEAVAIVRTTA